MIFKRGIPLFIAVSIGLLMLVGLLVPLPQITEILLGWATFIAAGALLLGVLNLFIVHSRRFFRDQNFYSGVLIVAMLAVLGLAVTDGIGITQGGVDEAFRLVQAPLEMAIASLLAFFLLTAGFLLMKRQRTRWSVLFLVSALLVLVGQILVSSAATPASVSQMARLVDRVLQEVVVTAGMRGILLGVALGTVTLSIRLLFGMERPYNK